MAARPAPRRDRAWPVSAILLAMPLGAVLVCFVVAPLLSVVAVSFFRYDNFAVVPAFTLENYQSVLTSHLTLSLYLTMMRLAALTWASPW